MLNYCVTGSGKGSLKQKCFPALFGKGWDGNEEQLQHYAKNKPRIAIAMMTTLLFGGRVIEHLTILSKLFISPKTEKKVSLRKCWLLDDSIHGTLAIVKGSGGDADCKIEFPGEVLIAVKTSIRAVLATLKQYHWSFVWHASCTKTLKRELGFCGSIRPS